MARFMCFRPIKKHQDSDAYGSLKKNFNANVAPYNRMVVRSPLEEGLTLHYLTSKLIVLSSPDEGTERAYSESLKSVTLTLKTKHYGHFKVWNVSRSRHDLTRCLLAEDYGWPACLAPPLDRLCVLCKQFEQWLTSHTDNVVVIHCKGDRSRAAIVVSSYLHYNAMCSDDDTIEDRCNIQQFVDKYIGGNGQPSHKRYITYFSSLLSGRIRVNSSPVYLKRITISHLVGRLIFLKIYERLDPVYQTQTVTCKDVTRFDVDQELRLRGDVLIKCYQVIPESRSVLFYCQINTCALELSRKEFNLTFYKEQLDSIFSDPSIDNRVAVTISISQDPPKTISIRKPLAETRSNSYENFSLSEDDPNPAVEYSVIQKKSSIVPKDTEELDKETDNWSSQNGVDSERESTVQGTQSTMPPPPVPPKPRSASALAEPTNDIPERRGVLPAQVRPLIHRPPSPREGRATPSIEPDLVGKDRYDKASKCFSYAPTKALNEAFDKPRRPSFSRTVERKEEEIQNVNPEEVINAPIHATDIVRVTETPKWDDEVEKAKQVALLNELAHVPTHTQSATSQSYYMRNEVDDREERPIVVEQAQRATTTTTTSSAPGWNKRRQTKYGSYRTLNDESYNSDMDDLCDPDFYLNYSTSAMKAIPKPPERAQHVGTKSVELPRKKFEPVETFTDPLDDILLTSGSVPAASCMDLRERDSFRGRNCRSVAALPLAGRTYAERRDSPFFRDKKLFAEHYDALSEAKDPDDWLTHKLRKVRSKREMDPDLIRRRTRERMLLEELKHAHDEKEVSRARVEADYSVEGMGTRSIDPLTEYRREEERLKNTHSPFDDIPRRNRQVRGKPPTPPPRDRSRSPARSERATPSLDVVKNNNYSSHRHQNGVTESEEFDFSNLSNTVKNNSAYPSRIEPRFDSRMEPCRNEYRLGPPDFYTDSRPLQRRQSFGLEKPPFQHNENTISGRPDTPTKFQSGQERVAAAIYRAETPQKEAYSSGTTQKTELSNRYFPENSTFVQRSETPAFPVTRETPIPYHPLLYSNNGSSRQDLERDRSNTLNYRSSSPRSQYYGQMSRRSSLTSVDTSEIIHHHPVFVKDTSKYWYKPTITREQAIGMLRDKAPGTFVVRDSNSFHGAFGLALKVATPPPGVMPGDGTELVRHFLIEPSPKGVKLKGCNNEPVFGSLSALVYQHSITPLALPTRLLLPEFDPATTPEHISATQALLEQGAACNVAYIGSVDVESLTGSECVRRATGRCIEDTQRRVTRPVSVHFKVSSQGVTLTDNTRKVFFRRHFPVNSVIYAGMDPAERRFDNYCVIGFHDSCVKSARLFAFVARKPSLMENACYVFAEFEPEQPASAVVNFINKVMLANRRG